MMRTRLVIAATLLASVAISAAMPVGAQDAFISPVIEPAPPVPTPDVQPTDQTGAWAAALTDHPRDGDEGKRDEPTADAPARWVYAGEPFGWVPVYE